MNLSQEERNIIYQEELKKRQKEKLDSIPEEERKKIFEEESKIKIVEVDSSMIKLSFQKRYKTKIFIIDAIILIIVAWFFSVILSFIMGCIMGIVEGIFNKDKIKFKCPYCGNERSLQMTNDSKVDNSNFLHNYNVYVKSNVKSELPCSKCNRKYEFIYTYLNQHI